MKKNIIFTIFAMMFALTMSCSFTLDDEYGYIDHPDFTGTIIPLELSTLTTGTLSDNTSSIIYRVSVVEGESYTIMWDDSFEGYGAYTADILVSVYLSDQINTYFYNADSGYFDPYSILVPMGENEIYIHVKPYYSYEGGTFGIRVDVAESGVAVTIN